MSDAATLGSPRRAPRLRRSELSGAALGVGLGLSLLTAGCSRCSSSDEEKAAAPSASASGLPAPVASGAPINPGALSKLVNPLDQPAYSGPTGSVAGRVIATGDPSIEDPEALAKIDDECAAARETYGNVLREGPGRTLADVLVSVNGYQGYVPEKEPIVRIEAKNCSWGTRMIAMTLGQRLEVKSGDQHTYIPELMGEPGQAQLVATPRGTSVSPLFPTRMGRYVLIDNLKLFMTAEVLVFNYATHDVTGLDGRFRIDGIPVGPAKVTAGHVATPNIEKPVVIEAGQTLELEFSLSFDAAAYRRATTADGGAPDAGPPPSGARDAGKAPSNPPDASRQGDF